MPEIEVESDFDGYFEKLVRNWCEQKKTPFRNVKIVISAGPYRSSAVTATRRAKNVLGLDFYSAIRTGFGSLSESEVQLIIDNWL
jgi:hypothetical protein